MRVLINQECAAVAGGDQSECERNVMWAGAITGGVIGAVAGGMAGGVGAAPGALAGAGTGGLIADLVGPGLCSWFGDDSSENSDDDTESDEDEGPAGNPFRPDSKPKDGQNDYSNPDYGPPLQYVIDTWEYA